MSRRYALSDQAKVCPRCDKSFNRPSRISDTQWEARKYCSYSCSRQKEITERLLARIEKRPGPLDDLCWIWTGPTRGRGYGRLIVNRQGRKKQWAAHRLSYREFVGPLSDGLMVCHRCDTPACINPDHLFLGTHADNMADRDSKGRNNAPRGPDKPSTKLSPDAIADIRAGGSPVKLAAEYGVSTSLIYKVRQGRAWGWL